MPFAYSPPLALHCCIFNTCHAKGVVSRFSPLSSLVSRFSSFFSLLSRQRRGLSSPHSLLASRFSLLSSLVSLASPKKFSLAFLSYIFLYLCSLIIKPMPNLPLPIFFIPRNVRLESEVQVAACISGFGRLKCVYIRLY